MFAAALVLPCKNKRCCLSQRPTPSEAPPQTGKHVSLPLRLARASVVCPRSARARRLERSTRKLDSFCMSSDRSRRLVTLSLAVELTKLALLGTRTRGGSHAFASGNTLYNVRRDAAAMIRRL